MRIPVSSSVEEVVELTGIDVGVWTGIWRVFGLIFVRLLLIRQNF
jgi:hypothetical protein